MKEYFNEKEKEGFDKLNDFNINKLHLNGFGRTPEKHHTDASGYTSDNRYLNIEIKVRNQSIKKQGNQYVIEGKTRNR